MLYYKIQMRSLQRYAMVYSCTTLLFTTLHQHCPDSQIKILQLAVEKQTWLNSPEDVGTCDSPNDAAIRIQSVFWLPLLDKSPLYISIQQLLRSLLCLELERGCFFCQRWPRPLNKTVKMCSCICCFVLAWGNVAIFMFFMSLWGFYGSTKIKLSMSNKRIYIFKVQMTHL